MAGNEIGKKAGAKSVAGASRIFHGDGFIEPEAIGDSTVSRDAATRAVGN